MSSSIHTTRPPGVHQPRFSYSQGDVDTIRSQIIEGESLKRRWLLLGLILVSIAFVGALFLMSTNAALRARTSAANTQLVQQNHALTQRAEDLQRDVDARNAREAERTTTSAQTEELFKRLMPSVSGDADVPATTGARFAQAVYNLGGSVKLDSKPSNKLFRNWKASNGSTTEVYTVIGGFVEGKWLIYSNLVSRRENTPKTQTGVKKGEREVSLIHRGY